MIGRLFDRIRAAYLRAEANADARNTARLLAMQTKLGGFHQLGEGPPPRLTARQEREVAELRALMSPDDEDAAFYQRHYTGKREGAA